MLRGRYRLPVLRGTLHSNTHTCCQGRPVFHNAQPKLRDFYDGSSGTNRQKYDNFSSSCCYLPSGVMTAVTNTLLLYNPGGLSQQALHTHTSCYQAALHQHCPITCCPPRLHSTLTQYLTTSQHTLYFITTARLSETAVDLVQEADKGQLLVGQYYTYHISHL